MIMDTDHSCFLLFVHIVFHLCLLLFTQVLLRTSSFGYLFPNSWTCMRTIEWNERGSLHMDNQRGPAAESLSTIITTAWWLKKCLLTTNLPYIETLENMRLAL